MTKMESNWNSTIKQSGGFCIPALAPSQSILRTVHKNHSVNQSFTFTHFYLEKCSTVYKKVYSMIFALYVRPQININTDAGLHVVIELVGKHIYTITLCVCLCVYVRKTPESGSLVVLSIRQRTPSVNCCCVSQLFPPSSIHSGIYHVVILGW